jgi:hypothetical protein
MTLGRTPVGHYVVCWLSVSGNSRSAAAMALTAAGSSVQCRAVRVQAWKFFTFDALPASASSAHASRSSAWSSGVVGAPGTGPAATTGLMGAAVAPLRRKRLLRPISVFPLSPLPRVSMSASMRPGHYDRAPSPMAKRIAAAEQTRYSRAAGGVSNAGNNPYPCPRKREEQQLITPTFDPLVQSIFNARRCSVEC